MKEIAKKILLAGDKFMPEMHLKQPGFTYSACGPFTRNKEFKNLCKQEIQIISIKINCIKLVFNMIRLMENTKTYKKEYNQIKSEKTKLLRLQTIQIMMDIKED